jgi:hypothetical protein
MAVVILTDAERTQYTTWLTEARNAYHMLATGRMARVFVDQNGERIEYSVGNRNFLAAYIADLERRLGLATVIGPLHPWF